MESGILLIKENGILKAATDEDRELIKKLPANKRLVLTDKKARNLSFHRKFYALLNHIYNNLRENSHPNIYSLRLDFQYNKGYFDVISEGLQNVEFSLGQVLTETQSKQITQVLAYSLSSKKNKVEVSEKSLNDCASRLNKLKFVKKVSQKRIEYHSISFNKCTQKQFEKMYNDLVSYGLEVLEVDKFNSDDIFRFL